MTIKLVKINKDNFSDAIELKTSEEHKKFVASNAYSIAQAQFNPGINCYGIYDGELMVGFTMYGIREEFDEDDKEPDKRFYIWRYMIANNQRCKGYGKKALQLIIDEAISLDQSVIGIDTSPTNMKAQALYESAGFKAISDYELVLTLKEEVEKSDSTVEELTSEIKIKPEIINLTTSELEQFCGLYRSEENNMFRKVVIKDNNQLYWQNDEGRSKFLNLVPVSKSDFIFAGYSDYLLKFEFDGKVKKIQFFEDDECSAKYTNYELVDLSAAELVKYVGSYFCKELDVTYQLKLDSDKLIIMIKNKIVSQVQPTKHDQLLVEEWDCFFSFVYNEQKEIIGLKSDEDRAKNFEFVKV